jgi:hypothetical protein
MAGHILGARTTFLAFVGALLAASRAAAGA